MRVWWEAEYPWSASMLSARALVIFEHYLQVVSYVPSYWYGHFESSVNITSQIPTDSTALDKPAVNFERSSRE